jgi:hypothetical protein
MLSKCSARLLSADLCNGHHLTLCLSVRRTGLHGRRAALSSHRGAPTTQRRNIHSADTRVVWLVGNRLHHKRKMAAPIGWWVTDCNICPGLLGCNLIRWPLDVVKESTHRGSHKAWSIRLTHSHTGQHGLVNVPCREMWFQCFTAWRDILRG